VKKFVSNYIYYQKRFNLDLHHISLGLLYAIFCFLLLTQGSRILGYWDDSWTNNLIFYMIGVEFFILMYDRLPVDLQNDEENKQKKQHNTVDNLICFIFLFLGFLMLFKTMSDLNLYFSGLSRLPLSMTIPTVIFQIGIVATSEEIIFRGVIFDSLRQRNHKYWAYILSSILFGLFHYAAYDASWQLMGIAMALALLMAYLYDRFNLGASIAFHGAYNCFVGGALYFMINPCW